MNNKKRKIKLLFVVYGQFPNGGAFINRLLGFAKGIIHEGHECRFLLLSKQNGEIFNTSSKVRYNDLILLDNSLCDNLFFKGNHRIFKLINYYVVIKKLKRYLEKNRKNYNVVYSYGMTFPFTHLIGKYARKNGMLTINEQTEFPFIISSKPFYKKIYRNYFIKNFYENFYGLVVISNSLKKYYKEKTHNTVPIRIINMIVEPSRFRNDLIINNKRPIKGDYIAYTGLIQGDKDGVPSLIRAFDLIHTEFPDLKLVLVGNIRDKRSKDLIYEEINDEIKDRVILTGRVYRDDIPRYINNAKLLCLARPNNIQAQGGFPTKLGEYLSTGKPVVITDTGEISKFLKDRENAYISKTNNPIEFSEKIKYALNHPGESENVGKEGLKLVYREFNYIVQSKNLLNFICDLYSKYNKI